MACSVGDNFVEMQMKVEWPEYRFGPVNLWTMPPAKIKKPGVWLKGSYWVSLR